MARWISKVVDSTIESESPERFQYWSAMSAISASLRKNVYLDRFYYKLYPNLYILLIGKSGLRKGNPVTLAKKLVQESEMTKIVAGRGSIQAILKELGKPVQINGAVLRDAHAFLVSGEASSFLVKDPQALPILTDLYDTHAHEPEWKNILKSSGTDILKNPCITFLWATNEEHLKEAIAQKDVKGGFMARSMVIYEEQRRTINDLMDPPQKVPNIQDLVVHLKALNKLKGEFKLSEEAKSTYREWYRALASKPFDDTTGYIERLGDTVLKVAMNLSAARGFDLKIDNEDMNEAIDVSTECMSGLKIITMHAGGAELTQPTALVLKHLLTREGNTCTRKQILSKYWGEVDSMMLDRIIETLVQAGAVTTKMEGKEIRYTMPQRVVEQYKKFKMEVN